MTTATTRTDLYARVTARILADLERGVRPWLQPWQAGPAAGRVRRPLRHNGTPYKGINIVILWGEAMAKGYASPVWMTFKQATTLGRPCPQGRARHPGGLRRDLHHDGDHGRRRSRAAAYPVSEDLHGL